MARPWAKAFLLGFLFLHAAGPASSADSAGKWLGKEAPGFTATDLEGRQVRLSELLGRSKAVVVNFWGVRCQSCLEEMPHLGALAAKFGPTGVPVIGVNSDGMAGDRIAEILPDIGIRPSYPLVTDPEFKIMDAFGVTATPLTLVVRPDGKVAYEHLGFTPGDERKLEAEIRKLVDAAAR